MEGKISSVADLFQDAHAGKDSAEMFARKAAKFKILSINPIVSNLLEYDPKQVKLQAGQTVILNIEYVVFGWSPGRGEGGHRSDLNQSMQELHHPFLYCLCLGAFVAILSGLSVLGSLKLGLLGRCNRTIHEAGNYRF